MSLIQKINTKLDQGYKLTTYFCYYCQSTTFLKPDDHTGNVYCPKCDKLYQPIQKQIDNNRHIDHNDDDQYYDQILDSIDKQNKQKAINNENNDKTQNKASDKKQQIQINKDENKQNNLEQDDDIQKKYLEFIQSQTQIQQQKKSQETSKKMGDKLIYGWSMMEQSCLNCNVPLMKSKQGNLICCSCDKDYSIKQNNKTKENQKNKQITANITNQQKQSSPSKKKIKQENNIVSKNKKQKNTQPQQRISTMVNKTLDFLQLQLDRTIKIKDLQAIKQVFKTMKQVKQLINL